MDAIAVVRDLCDAFARMNTDELLGFFTPDAVYEKIPVGRFEGQDEIRGTLEEFFGPEVKVKFEILHLGASEDTVFVERVIHFETCGKRFALPAMAIFEVIALGLPRIIEESFDSLARSCRSRIVCGLTGHTDPLLAISDL